ncbi:hypothetical protein BZG36_01191 [Bifiguratus adelaidae]|uniref:N-acetyltransferase domain-containing protein n=1 Tax=Bifiguratus adelaidae TaxID=1938954 RepID=A0A261Y5P8_9FUNG|nr:hypothetical protein BZG36_01191 [Bifiguratus adelaidae]
MAPVNTLPVNPSTCSYWLQDAPYQQEPTHSLPCEADVVVVGGGITGMSALYWLQQFRPEDKIVLLEARGISSGATGRNGGICWPGLNEGFRSSINQYGVSTARSLLKFEQECVRQMQHIIETYADTDGGSHDPQFRVMPQGGMLIFKDQEQREEGLDDLAALQECGFAEGVKFLKPEELEQLIGINPETCTGGLQVPGVVIFWAAKFVFTLTREILKRATATSQLDPSEVSILDSPKRNVQIFTHTPVNKIERSLEDTRTYNVQTSRGNISATKVILATNAWTEHILPSGYNTTQPVPTEDGMTKAAKIKITPVRNQVISLRPISEQERLINCAVSANAGYEYYSQRPNGDVIFGGMRNIHLPDMEYNVANDAELVPLIGDALRQYLPKRFPRVRDGSLLGETLEPTHEWAGIMGFAPEDRRLPYVGQLKAADKDSGIYICAGYTGQDLDVEWQSIPDQRQRYSSVTLLDEAVNATDTEFEEGWRAKLPTFRTGDFAEVHLRGKTFTGIVWQPLSDSRKITIVSRTGRALTFNIDRVAYHVPDFANLTSTQRALPEPITLNSVDALKGFRRPIDEFVRAAEQTRSANFIKYEKAYVYFWDKHQREGEEGDCKVTARQVAEHVHGKVELTPTEIYAAHLHLEKDDLHFIPSPLVCINGEFTLRPQDEANMASLIKEWIRFKDGPFTSFVDKANTMLKFREQHVDKFGILKGEATMEPFSEFKGKDEVFLNMIRRYASLPTEADATQYEVFVSAILKATGFYRQYELNRDVAAQFLRDLGLWTPWDNTPLRQHPNALAHHLMTPTAAEHNRTMSKAASMFLHRGEDKADFYEADNCINIRRDFGHLPAYAIDDASANEIDDAISIDQQGNNTWVHVHVADPTAYIPPGHNLARIANARVQTLYLPQLNVSMLPTALTQQNISLGSTSQSKQFTMTFSFCLAEDGSINDYRIGPGIVRNVQRLTYDQVDKSLGVSGGDESITEYQHTQDDGLLIRTKHNPQDVTPLPDEACKDLIQLQSIAITHQKIREAEGGVAFNRLTANVTVAPRPLELTPISNMPHFQRILPSISVFASNGSSSPAHVMVAEMMVIAGRVCAQFAKERNIPMPYRVQPAPSLEGNVQRALANNTSGISAVQAAQLLPLMHPAAVSTFASMHWALGIHDGYVKVTSPLRRYLDLLSHWNIKASLLNEGLPFSKQWIDVMGPAVQQREKELNRIEQQCDRWWVLELLRRYKLDGYQGLWTFRVERASEDRVHGTIEELAIGGQLKGIHSIGDVAALPSGYKVRPLSRGDYERGFLQTLQVLTEVGQHSREDWNDRFDYMKKHNHEYFTIVITDPSSRVVGAGTIFIERKFVHHNGLVGHIEDIAVDANQQGKKLGLRVIQALKYIGTQAGVYKVILDCSDKNIPFYEKCGFKHKEYEMVWYVPSDQLKAKL